MKMSNVNGQIRITRGYTLVELMIAVGLFAFIMTLAAGAYLVMISVNRQTQALSIGINNLAFALETMTRTIRTNTHYSCDGGLDCVNGGNIFEVQKADSSTVTYARSQDNAITQNGSALTDPLVSVTSLTFYASGTAPGGTEQPHVTIVVSGTVSAGANKTVPFIIETGATMRGTDL